MKRRDDNSGIIRNDSRTIADLANSSFRNPEHLSGAIQSARAEGVIVSPPLANCSMVLLRYTRNEGGITTYAKDYFIRTIFFTLVKVFVVLEALVACSR